MYLYNCYVLKVNLLIWCVILIAYSCVVQPVGYMRSMVDFLLASIKENSFFCHNSNKDNVRLTAFNPGQPG